MTSYRRFIGFLPPPSLSGNLARPAAFAPLMVHRLRRKAKSRQEAALVDWEEEGGRLAAPGGGAKRS